MLHPYLMAEFDLWRAGFETPLVMVAPIILWTAVHSQALTVTCACAGTSIPAGIAATESALLRSKLRSMVRPALGSAAFLAAVECTWQLHEQ